MTTLKDALQKDKFNKIIDTATKFKKVMLKRDLTKAVTNCPICKGEKSLHGQLSKTLHRGSRHFMMRCTTPNCLMFME